MTASANNNASAADAVDATLASRRSNRISSRTAQQQDSEAEEHQEQQQQLQQTQAMQLEPQAQQEASQGQQANSGSNPPRGRRATPVRSAGRGARSRSRSAHMQSQPTSNGAQVQRTASEAGFTVEQLRSYAMSADELASLRPVPQVAATVAATRISNGSGSGDLVAAQQAQVQRIQQLEDMLAARQQSGPTTPRSAMRGARAAEPRTATNPRGNLAVQFEDEVMRPRSRGPRVEQARRAQRTRERVRSRGAWSD